MSSPLLLSLSLYMLGVVHSQNATNTTEFVTTSATSTTQYFTTGDTVPIDFNESFSPTQRPTEEPTKRPTNKPTTAPTVPIPNGLSQLFKLVMKLFGVDQAWIQANKEALIQICCSATGVNDCGADTQIAIGTLQSVTDDDDATTRRRLLANGVQIQFLISMKNPSSVVRIQSAVSSGSFLSQFNSSITDNYDHVTLDAQVELIDEGQGDGEEFLGEEEPGFAELIASPYILLGVVCIVVGTIWLLFLRSTIENKYPSYLAQPAMATAPQSVEMVPQTSDVSAEGPAQTAIDDGDSDHDNAPEPERKLTNKQELEAAWNDSDAEASGDDPDETRL